MSKMTPEKLAAIRHRRLAERSLSKDGPRTKIIIHMGTCGIAAGADKILERVNTLMKEHNTKDVLLLTSGCAGLCSREPMLTIQTSGKPPAKYAELTEHKITRIFEEHVIGGTIAENYLLAIGSETTR